MNYSTSRPIKWSARGLCSSPLPHNEWTVQYSHDVVMNKRFEEAFDFIKHVFKVKKLYDDQTRLIEAFCAGRMYF